MRLFALVCAVLMAISAPALAQTNPPPVDTSGTLPPGLTPGGVVLGLAGAGLLTWGIIEASKKSDPVAAPKKEDCATTC